MPALTILKTIWVFIKKYWWIAAAIVGFIVFELVFKSGTSPDLSATLAAIQKKHEEELAAIKAADDTRQKAYVENEKVLKARLAEIERQYAEAQVQLDAKKRSELEKILKDTADDPVALAQKLSDATGFNVILPQ